MKNLKLNKSRYLLLSAVVASCTLFAGCLEDINNYEKTTPSEASNHVFVNDKYATLSFHTTRTADGVVTNMDTLIAKMVVNCTSPAGGDLSVKVNIDSLLVEVYNKKNESSRMKIQGNWLRLNKSTLTIKEGTTESDTLTIALLRSLDKFADLNGYIMPIRMTSVTGYDVQLDYSKRISYLTLDVTQENGVGFVKGRNSNVVRASDLVGGYYFPLVSVIPSDKDVNVELEIANNLIADVNSKCGTDYKTFPTEGLSLADNTVTLQAGSTVGSGKMIYAGDLSILASGNYLIPIKVKSVTSNPAGTVKTLKTNVHYLIVDNVNALSLEADESSMGTKQTDRLAYRVTASSEPTVSGSWEGIFKGSKCTTGNRTDLIIDLGREVSNISGVHIQSPNAATCPARIDVGYATESLFTTNSLFSQGYGTIVTPARKDMYIKFENPVTARIIRLNSVMPPAGTGKTYAIQQFYIYTKE